MLVLEPIFEANRSNAENLRIPRWSNAQQAAVEVRELLFRGHPAVVDATARTNSEHSALRPSKSGGASCR